MYLLSSASNPDPGHEGSIYLNFKLSNVGSSVSLPPFWHRSSIEILSTLGEWSGYRIAVDARIVVQNRSKAPPTGSDNGIYLAAAKRAYPHLPRVNQYANLGFVC